MKTSNHHKLSAQIRVVIQIVGKGKSKRHIRRPLLIDGYNGLLHELQTVYVYRNLAHKSLNTQRATLRDLAFFLEWISIKRNRDPKWLTSEKRVSKNQIALSRKEIDDLSRWCQLTAKEIANVRYRESHSIRRIPAGTTVEVATTNSRLHNICNYLIWLTEEFIEGTLNLEDTLLAKSEKYKRNITLCFKRNISRTKKAPPILSLDESQSKALLSAINSNEIFSNSPHGTRDRLIANLLYGSGIRSGELLKLRCEDIIPSYQTLSGKSIGVIDVIRRPNDPADERKFEPSVKTLPGPVTISSHLANQIIKYITNERRIAVDRRKGNIETPYLFVCLSSSNIGLPISQRNLNRIIEKLKNIEGLPDWLSPHVFRHTHFTQLADINSRENLNADDILINRGHWTPDSKAIKGYSQRHIINKSAELIEKRDQILNGDNGG